MWRAARRTVGVGSLLPGTLAIASGPILRCHVFTRTRNSRIARLVKLAGSAVGCRFTKGPISTPPSNGSSQPAGARIDENRLPVLHRQLLLATLAHADSPAAKTNAPPAVTQAARELQRVA